MISSGPTPLSTKSLLNREAWNSSRSSRVRRYSVSTSPYRSIATTPSTAAPGVSIACSSSGARARRDAKRRSIKKGDDYGHSPVAVGFPQSGSSVVGGTCVRHVFPDYREQVVEVEWFGEELDALQTNVRNDCAHQHDGHRIAYRSQMTHQPHTAKAWHLHVRDNQIGGEHRGLLERGETVVHHADAKSLVLQEGREDLGEHPLVVDNQNKGCLHRACR